MFIGVVDVENGSFRHTVFNFCFPNIIENLKCIWYVCGKARGGMPGSSIVFRQDRKCSDDDLEQER